MSPKSDPHDLQRFVDAQSGIYEQVLAELRRGRKTSHWIWFIFPQIAGLGSSETARRYAVADRDEAAAYVGHPLLGPRLKECAGLVNQVAGRTIDDILGYPDNLKFRSSMTLFHAVSPDEPVFSDALTRYFSGEPDPATLARL